MSNVDQTRFPGLLRSLAHRRGRSRSTRPCLTTPAAVSRSSSRHATSTWSWARQRVEHPCAIGYRSTGSRRAAAHGFDVDEAGDGTLADQRLHQLIRQQGSIGERTVEIEFLDAGAEAYCFTFG